MSEKIFVDLDEEIIFIAEKIKNVEGGKVILIVPDRAALLGSVVSLKLLSSEIAKSGKLAILVTKDEVGLKLAKNAKLVAVEQVSEINKEKWEQASRFKEEFVEGRENVKRELISEREEKKEPLESEDTSSTKEVATESKIAPKKVDLGGFEMVAGGDIAQFETDEETEALGQSETAGDVDEEKRTLSWSEKKERAGLVGKDLSTYSYMSRAPKKKKEVREDKRGFSLSESFTGAIDNVKKFFTSGGNKPKIFIGVGVVLLLFFILSYFVFPRGRVIIKVESKDIELEEQVVADTAVTTLDIEALTIPAKMIESSKDRSESADATGEKETGEKASGQVTLFNMTESDVRVVAGTTLESVESGLKYKTAGEVVVPAKKPDDDPESPGLIGNIDVGVVADSFGEEYNVSGKKEFRVQGYDVENLYGKNFNNITGGTTVKKKVVSQQDYDTLKDSLVKQLEEDLLESLKQEAGTSRELLEDTIAYEVVNEDASPGVDAEADTFNLSITVKATALSFLKEDVDNLAQVLVEQNNEQEVEVEEFEYKSQVLRTEGNQIYITLSITGVVTPSVNEDDVKVNIKGKNRGSAEEYLNGVNEIKSYEIELSPTWLPSFLKHFPSSVNRIEVVVEKA
ncbi:hypothetical protein JW766_01200 [Candidatus Dojkabacteria bacterium]|nr:hypothetical protein [Candidatus Dojkabacteria bacterium]